MDRQLVSGALALLLLQVIYMLGDLGILSIPMITTQERATSAKVIGQIIDTREKVKIKNVDAVIWQDSQTNETLHFNDAILTLNNSKAILKLNNEIDIEVHENTLVVLENNISENSFDPLRIRFQKGFLNTRSTTQKLRLGSKDWVLDASAGTKLSVRTINNDNLELEVQAGEVQLKNNQTAMQKQIQSGERVRLDKAQILETESLSQKIELASNFPARIYSHKFPYFLNLEWTEDVDKLRVLNPDKSENIINVNAKNYNLSLNAGTYSFSWLKDSKSSPHKTVEIVPAPRIFYTRPLPRDRLTFPGPHTFSWLPVQDTFSYEILIGENYQKTTSSPIIKVHDLPLGYALWSVQAKDKDGFQIPPFYEIPVYHLKNTLSAPKTHSPKERMPASDKKPKPQSYLQNFYKLLLASAYAETIERQIVFSWYPVDGADFYVIEISRRPDFLQPDIIETITETEFVWNNFSNITYYWRVAAGSHQGQMGVFSEPQEFNVDNLKDLSPGSLGVGLKIEKATPSPTPTVDPSPSPTPPSPTIAVAPQPTPPVQSKTSWHLDVQMHEWIMSQKSNKLDVSNKGFSIPSIRLGYKTMNDNKGYLFEIDYSKLEWKPKNESAIPFQDEFTTNITQLSAIQLIDHKRGHKGHGPIFWQFPIIERAAPEKVIARDYELLGYQYLRDSAITDKLNWQSRVGLLHSGGVTMFSLQNIFNQPFQEVNSKTLHIGIRFDVLGYTGSNNRSGHGVRLGVDLGF